MAEMDAAAYLKRGEAFFSKEDFDQAIPDFREAYRLANINLAAAYFNRGVGSFQKGDTDRAVTDLTVAINLNPEDATFYGARGTMYRQKGDYDGVIRDFTGMIRLDPNSAAPYLSRAGAYHEKCKESRSNGDENSFFRYIDLCINDCSAALRIEPGNAKVREMLKHVTNERELRKEVYKSIKNQ